MYDNKIKLYKTIVAGLGARSSPKYLVHLDTNMKRNNTITHIEIPAPNLAKAISFYTTVFNWKIEIVAESSYAYFMIGDTNTGGGLDASLKPAAVKCGPQIVVDVDDIEQVLDRINASGGSITMAKTKIEGDHGFYAAFQDPNGNHLQIHCRQ